MHLSIYLSSQSITIMSYIQQIISSGVYVLYMYTYMLFN